MDNIKTLFFLCYNHDFYEEILFILLKVKNDFIIKFMVWNLLL